MWPTSLADSDDELIRDISRYQLERLTEAMAEIIGCYIVALFANRITGQACGLKLSCASSKA